MMVPVARLASRRQAVPARQGLAVKAPVKLVLLFSVTSPTMDLLKPLRVGKLFPFEVCVAAGALLLAVGRRGKSFFVQIQRHSLPLPRRGKGDIAVTFQTVRILLGPQGSGKT
ncbi:hypothetical protein HYY27_11105 [bacterium]|nr:hypothetical protein [bacterium]